MNRKITQVSRTSARVKPAGAQFKRIDRKLVAERLGAQRVAVVAELRGGAAALFALREELARRLVSTGGRPCLEGTARRQKIPLSEEDWRALEELAAGLSDKELRPTAGQVASVLLHHALEDIVDDVALKTSIKKRARAASKAG
jgi:hypothetical protein